MVKTLATIVLLIIMTACSSIPKLQYSENEIRNEFKNRLNKEELAAVEIPFSIPDSFAEVIESKLKGIPKDSKLDFLIDYIIRQNHFNVKYTEGLTNTASQVIKDGQGNCIALSHLMIGIMRKFNIPSYYVYILNSPTFSFWDHTISVNYHVMVGISARSGYRFYDFQPRYNKNPLLLNGVNDLEGIALHYNNLGAENMQLGDYQKAKLYLSIANKLAPDNTEVLSNYGLYFLRIGNTSNAKNLFIRATTLDKTCYPAWHNLMYVTLLESDRNEFNKLLTEMKNVNSPTIKLFLANMAYQEGKYNQTLDYLSGINPEMTKLFIVYLLKAQAYYKLGKFQHAKKYLTNYQNKNPDDLHAFLLEEELSKKKF